MPGAGSLITSIGSGRSRLAATGRYRHFVDRALIMSPGGPIIKLRSGDAFGPVYAGRWPRYRRL